MSGWSSRLVWVLAAAAALGGAWPASARSVARDGGVRVSGNIEVTDVQVAFRIAGRVARRLVAEGEGVTNGQVVALLETAELEQELALRQAEVRAAAAVVAELEAGARPEEIAQATAALDMARADAARQSSEFARQNELHAGQVISDREFEAVTAARDMAAARAREAEARLTLLRNGPRAETLDAARARLAQVRAAAALAETRLGFAELRSPLAGVVLSEGAESGEYVAPGTPIVTVGDLDRVWLRAYVEETELGRVKLGASVKITTDTYPGKVYEGRVTFISDQAEFTPRNVQTAKERVKLVYRIKVVIPNARHELKPGMPADAEVAGQP